MDDYEIKFTNEKFSDNKHVIEFDCTILIDKDDAMKITKHFGLSVLDSKKLIRAFKILFNIELTQDDFVALLQLTDSYTEDNPN